MIAILRDRPMMILIIVNLITLVVIFWLLGMIMVEKGEEPEPAIASATQPVESAPQTEIVAAPPPSLDATADTVDEDARTAPAAAQVQAAADARVETPTTDVELTVTPVLSAWNPISRAAEPGTVADAPINFFNSIDVSSKTANDPAALVNRLQEVVKNTRPVVTDTERDYLARLQAAADEHANQMRIIRVRRADTLWRISRRAYGTGFNYQRIMEANPQLQDPYQITPGEILRVPR